jgi:hypothetical protein
MKHRIVRWSAVAIGMLVMGAAQARPIPLVKPSALHRSTTSFQFVGDGVYPASGSKCYVSPTQQSTIQFMNGGLAMTAPIVVGVFWPGAQSPDPSVHALLGDFVTDLFNGAHFGHREHPDRSIVNTQIGIVNTGIGDRERSEATLGVQALSGASPFLQDGPLRAIRWALWSSRSQMASATVASPS